MKKKTTKEFISDAVKVHGAKYNYSKVKYINAKTKVEIICPVHGFFNQKPNDHLSGKGCLKCGREKLFQSRKSNQQDFLEKARNIHGDRYDYSLVEYRKVTEKIDIKCRKHGAFKIRPSNHLSGQGCSRCSEEKVSQEFRNSLNSVVDKFKEKHGNKYDYSKVIYKNSKTKVTIVCPKHGEFQQTPWAHTQYGCRKCGFEITKNSQRTTFDEFLEKAKQIHGDKYDYSQVEYVNNKVHVTIVCPVHGEFVQTPFNHVVQKNNCPKCSMAGTSQEEQELCDFVRSLDLSFVTNNRIEIFPYELDIFFPNKKVAIEYNGLYWHSEEFKDKKYHEQKTILCNEKGIHLIHFFSDEWRDKREICESMIKNRLGLSESKIYARKCVGKEIQPSERRKFVNENHISGKTNALVSFGLYNEGELVSVLSMSKPRQKKYDGFLEIKRFCSKKDTNVVGGLSKLLKIAKSFVKENGFKGIMTYADRRFGEGRSYLKCGFERIGETSVDYWYTDTINRQGRFTIRAQKGLSEKQVADNFGLKKIFGCGSNIYLLTT